MYRRQPPRRYACTRCVQLKVKCVPIGTGPCQRCIRLGHPTCVFPFNVRGSPAADRENTSFFHETISDDLANKLLSKYRTQKSPHFPFVVVTPKADASTLRKESPFLLLCILTASLEHDYGVQSTLEMLVRKEIASRVIVGVERNMDILQGLLVHAAWYHYHWETYHTHHYMLLQMASMVVGDLGLDRQESFSMQHIPRDGKEPRQAKESTTQTAAGKRALLGCYYLCSKSSLFCRQLHMRHTSWIDQCAEYLTERAEYPTDLKLKAYIDAQSRMSQSQLLFDEKRQRGDWQIPVDWDRVLKLTAQQREHTDSLLSSFEAHDWPLSLEVGAAPALLLGQSLRRQSHVFKLQELNQLEFMTTSAQQTIDTFLKMPSATALHLTSAAYATIWFCLLAISKLSLLFRPHELLSMGMDRAKVHENGVAIIRKFETLSSKEGFWTSSKRVVGSMLAWLEKSSSDSQRPQTAEAGSAQHQDAGTVPSTEAVPENDGTMDVQTQADDDIDFGVWDQMLDSFTWFGSGVDNHLNFGNFGL